MKPETKKLMGELSGEYADGAMGWPLEQRDLQEAFENGFEAAHALAEQEIAELKNHLRIEINGHKASQDYIAELKFENERLFNVNLDTAFKDQMFQLSQQLEKENENLRDEITILTASLKSAVDTISLASGAAMANRNVTLEQVLDKTIKEIKAKHPDMFKEGKE